MLNVSIENEPKIDVELLNSEPIDVETKTPVIQTGVKLPAVTENDDGKVLKVQSGIWSIGNDNEGTALSNLEIEELIRNFK